MKVVILTGRIYTITSYDWIPVPVPNSDLGTAGMTKKSKRGSRPKLKLNPLFRAIRNLKNTQLPDEQKCSYPCWPTNTRNPFRPFKTCSDIQRRTPRTGILTISKMLLKNPFWHGVLQMDSTISGGMNSLGIQSVCAPIVKWQNITKRRSSRKQERIDR